MKIIVVIPAYNEEPRIGAVIRRVREMLPDAEVLVINDASHDNTVEVARDAGAVVVTHLINLGYAAGLETGYLYAKRNQFDIVVQMDGDGQHLPEEIEKILGPVLHGDADLVIGSRLMEKNIGYRQSKFRTYGQLFFSLIFKLLTSKRISDTTSGFQCLNRKCIDFYLGHQFPEDYPDVNILLMAHFAGFRIKEVPVKMIERAGGKSMHSGLKPMYYLLKMLLSISLIYVNRKEYIHDEHVS
jgi:glycosyltransferase involved in cell wall biosynthesis